MPDTLTEANAAVAVALIDVTHFNPVQQSLFKPLPKWSGTNSLSMSVIGQTSTNQILGAQTIQRNAAAQAQQSTQSQTTPLQDAVLMVGQYFGAARELLSNVQKNLDRGDMVTAQNYLNQFWSGLAVDNSQGEDPIVADDPFLSRLWTLGQALDKGDFDAAVSAYKDAQANSPEAVSEKFAMDKDTANFDASVAVYNVQHGGGMPRGQLTEDIATLDLDLREESTLMSGGLQAEGDSKVQANELASEITGIHNGTAEENATEDAERANKWIDSLIALADDQKSGAPDTTVTLSTIDSLLGSVLMGTLEAWNQLKDLIDLSLDPKQQNGQVNSSAPSFNAGSIHLVA